MDPEELRRFARQFQNRMTFAAKPRPRPKLGLALLTASHHYKAALEAAMTARRELVAKVIERTSDAQAALDALNLLSDSFGFPPFTEADVSREDEPG
jgi:hypothetical protein